MFFQLPYRKFTIDSNLSRTEIICRLFDSIAEPRKNWQLFENRPEIFEGELSESGFQIKRIIRYRNSFLPIINGSFSFHENGSKIMITMELHPLVLAFLALWTFPLVAIGLLCLLSLIVSIITTGIIDFDILVISLVLIGMFLFCYFLTITGFNIEANKARQILYELLS